MKRTHGMRDHPVYRAWCNMNYRCYNPKFTAFRHYGGRGIAVCRVWRRSFFSFWTDMGPAWKPGLELDRVNVNKNYSPKNCRWTTHSVQVFNQRKRAGTSSRFRGVGWHFGSKKFRAYITIAGHHQHLGLFSTELDALRARKRAEYGL